MPASGPIGLAIKGYLVAHMARIEDLEPDDPCMSLGTIKRDDYFNGMLIFREQGIRSLAEDAARFVPEIAPLVAGIVDAPAASLIAPNVVRLRPRRGKPPAG